jgi:hypothetical protein
MVPTDSSFGQIITFYSYKGGTGRSMTLANIAYLLATDQTLGGKKVLMIDWDLEAPGLHRFFERDFVNRFGPPDRAEYAAALNTQPGLIDYFAQVYDYYEQHAPEDGVPVRSVWETPAQQLFADVTTQVPLDAFVIDTDITGLALMKSGNTDAREAGGPSYADRVRAFDWDRFYGRYGSFLELLRERLVREYDYVLVDSRTGLTDTSGICTRVLPEKLVAVFVPNRQNIDGTLGVVDSAVTFRMHSRDTRPLITFPLASRIDASASTLRTIWWRGGELEGQRIPGYQKEFEDAFRELYGLDQCDLSTYFADAQIPHDSDYAYGERVAARTGTQDKLSIGHACRAFAECLIGEAPPWERAAPLPVSAPDADSTISRKVKERPWHQLPRVLALTKVIEIRNELRAKNLYDTEEPLLTTAPASKQLRDSRTLDGSANDVQYATMGSAGRRFGRNVPLPSAFPDAANLLVPNPRHVSRVLMTRETFQPAPMLNLLAAAWMQFVVHPSLEHRYSNARFIDIPLPPNDTWPARTIRVPATEADSAPSGSKRPPAYASVRSHWWDASQIYGAEAVIADQIRTGTRGQLRVEKHGTLPLDPGTGVPVTASARDWWIGTALLHTLFTLEHNFICDELASRHPGWRDDQLFAKARLTIAALMMKIHVIEWFAAMVPNRAASGTLATNWHGLSGEELQDALTFIDDAETIGGTVGGTTDHFGAPYALTEELAAVCRMHPMLPDELSVTVTGQNRSRSTATYEFPDVSGRHAAELFDEYGAATLLAALGTAHPGAITLHNYPRFLQRHDRGDGEPIDLAAVDILRDRERGVPRYNEFLRQLRKEPVRSFDDLTDNPQWRKELEQAYGGDLDKVDLMVGLLAEPLPTGFGFSETAYRILLLMTSRQLRSDRFFTSDFSPEIYSEFGMEHIKKSDLSKVLLRHYPELAPYLSGVTNAFRPWNTQS